MVQFWNSEQFPDGPQLFVAINFERSGEVVAGVVYGSRWLKKQQVGEIVSVLNSELEVWLLIESWWFDKVKVSETIWIICCPSVALHSCREIKFSHGFHKNGNNRSTRQKNEKNKETVNMFISEQIGHNRGSTQQTYYWESTLLIQKKKLDKIEGPHNKQQTY